MSESTFVCSYARGDHPRISPKADVLRKGDFNVWIDVEDIRPAVEWLREVEAAIADAAAFVLFLSPAYVGSEVCRHEASHARTDGKKIVPVLLEPCGDLAGEVIVDDIWLRYSNEWHPDGGLLAYDTGTSVSLVDRNGKITPVDDSDGQVPISCSPDGALLITYGDGRLSLFELDSTRSLALLGEISVGYTVPQISWSSDGQYMSISGTELLGDFPDPYVQIVDTVTGQFGGQIFGSTASPTGRVAFIETSFGWEALFSLENGDVDRVMEDEFLADEPYTPSASDLALPGVEATALAASGDGRDIALGGADGSLGVEDVSVVDGDGGGAIEALRWHPSDAYVLAMSAAGRIIVATSDGEHVGDLAGRVPAQEATDVAWSQDGGSVVVAWPNGEITTYIFDPLPEPTVASASEVLNPIVWSPTGDRLAVGDDTGRITILNADGSPTNVSYTPEEAGVFGGFPVWDMAWSPDGQFLAAEYGNGGFALVRTATEESIGFWQMRWTGPLGIAWAPGSSTVATMDQDLLPVFLSTDGEWSSTHSGTPVFEDTVADVRFTMDGAVAIRTYDGDLTVFEEDGSVRFTTNVNLRDSLLGGTSHPLLISGESGLQILGEDGTQSAPLTADPGWEVQAVWSPDAALLAIKDNDFEVALFDSGGESVKRVMVPARQPIDRIAWQGDSKSLITHHENGETWLIDLSQPSPAAINLRIGSVNDAMPSPNGRELATISSDGMVEFRTSVQPADLCEELLGFVDEASFVTALSELSSQRVCIPGAELAEITTAPTSLHRPTTSSVTEATGGPGDLSVIASSYDGEHLVLGPISVGDTSFAFSGNFQDMGTNELAVWEFNGQAWVKDPTLLEPGGYYPFIVGLDELDVDSDGVSEVLVRFAPNDFVGVVLRYTAGIWTWIGGGENLEYIPGEGLYGVGNDCDLSCAEGSPVCYTLVWDGTELVSERTD